MGSFPIATTEFLNPLDHEEFRKQAHLMVDFLADYYKNIEKYPVCSRVKPGFLTDTLPDSAPTQPQPIETILQEVTKHIIPGITHWQSPNFFGYFPSSLSTASFLGEMLLTGFDIVGFNWLASPSATELEIVVMEWLRKLLQLPKSFSFSTNGGGVMHGTTCESFVCTLVAARDKKLNENSDLTLEKLVVYSSDQTHCSLQKAGQIVGISPKNIRAIRTTRSNNFRMCPDALLTAIESDVKSGFVPLYLCLTVGTTQTTAADPLGILCEVAKKFGIWCHVDAAYAGNACILPEFRHFLDGVESADSFSFNAHKWLLTSLGCCCLWVKDRTDLTKSLSTDPEYLKNKATDSKQVVDYKDWQITLSRRFLSMKLWMVMKSYGVSGLREFLRRHVNMAKHFEALLENDKRFEVVVPRNFATVCFRVLPVLSESGGVEDSNRLTRKLLDSLNGTGTVYLTHAVVEDIYVIRVAIGATLTEEKHVDMLWDMVQEHTNALMAC